MIAKEAFNELCLHSKFKLMRKILKKLYHKLKGCWTKMIYCLFGFKWFYKLKLIRTCSTKKNKL